MMRDLPRPSGSLEGNLIRSVIPAGVSDVVSIPEGTPKDETKNEDGKSSNFVNETYIMPTLGKEKDRNELRLMHEAGAISSPASISNGTAFFENIAHGLRTWYREILWVIRRFMMPSPAAGLQRITWKCVSVFWNMRCNF